MVFGGIVSSPLAYLSAHQALELANVYLENANNASDANISLVLCHDTEVSLSQAKKAAKYSENQALIDGIAAAYVDLGKLLERRGHGNEAQSSYKKAEKLGLVKYIKDTFHSPGGLHSYSSIRGSPQVQYKRHRNAAKIPAYIFAKDVPPPAADTKFPESGERLNNTPQLVCCLDLLQDSHSPDEILDPAAHKWLQEVMKDADEQERLRTTAKELIRAFKRDEIKDAKIVAEVVSLAPVLNKDAFHDLLRELYSGIDNSGLLNYHQLEGLAKMIQGANLGHLGADDLVKILGLLSTRLRDTHHQSTDNMSQLTMAVSNVLDAMADTKVTGLDRQKLHEPLSKYLKELQESKDSYLVYQAAYAYQALLCVPDNETAWQAAMRRSGKVIQGVAGLVSAAKGLDLVKFMEGLEDIQKGCAGACKVVDVFKTAYDGVTSLAESGQTFLECLKDGLSFECKRDWYSALRGADILIRDGELASFKKLVCEAPCRLDVAFQWGVCQRLGEIAANSVWDAGTRRSAIAFLGEIYRDDEEWKHPSVKQWILNILMQMELATDGNEKKQELYRMCREKGPASCPFEIPTIEPSTPSLLDRVQNRQDVEGNLRLLRKQRTQERSNIVYIPPQAKLSFRSLENSQFPLMEKVKEFLESDQKVLLLLGDSGAGKSTFCRELEYELWGSYKDKNDRIPLHINLPAIDKPEHDMIAKQLRRNEFTEPQIRELKFHRRFILICDGYDESQQTHNL
ncbi:hypothetical protein BGX34_002105, partial [Mortierella sp. NVP85]